MSKKKTSFMSILDLMLIILIVIAIYYKWGHKGEQDEGVITDAPEPALVGSVSHNKSRRSDTAA